MTATRPETDERNRDPITDHVHDNSWSANLEQPVHAEDRERVVRDAIEAVEHTAPGNHVNLVSHADHGHPGNGPVTGPVGRGPSGTVDRSVTDERREMRRRRRC